MSYDVTVTPQTTSYDVTVESPSATYVVAVSYARGPQGPVGPKGDPGSVDTVTAGDSTIVVGGTATAPTIRANVGTGPGTVMAGDDNRITGALQASNNLSDLTNKALARSNLGVGAAITDHGTTSGTVTLDASGDAAHKVSASGPLTFAFSGWPTGQAPRVRLLLTPGSNPVTWPVAVSWMGNKTPALKNGPNLLEFTSWDMGNTIIGDFRGGTVILPAVGEPFMGGYFAGIIDTTKGNIITADASQTGLRYALIVSPKSLESSSLQWRTALAAGPAASRTRWDGLAATTAMNNATYPAAQWCAGRSYPSDGASPWYLPAMDELEVVYRMLKSTTESNYTTAATGAEFPAASQSPGYNPSSDPVRTGYTAGSPARTSVTLFQAGQAQALGRQGQEDYYWTSTEYNAASGAWVQYMSGSFAGNQGGNNKNVNNWVRPCRRLVL